MSGQLRPGGPCPACGARLEALTASAAVCGACWLVVPAPSGEGTP